MKRKFQLFFTLYFTCLLAVMFSAGVGCANIVPPGGGPRDSLPPVLVTALPKDSATNFTGNKISLNFDEYVEIQNVFENVLVSPLPKNTPVINYNFRTVSVKIKDTLEPNTTYSINFGNAIKDINEGNVLKDFTYVFSTGNTIDQNTLSGNVVMAESGKIDSTLIVVLHKNLDDSAVVKDRPRYVAKLDGKGNFKFTNLAAGTFALYALPNDYSKKYDDTTKPFAFADSLINSTDNTPTTLYAYQLHKIDTGKKSDNATTDDATKKDKKGEKSLVSKISFEGNRQDILKNLNISFSNKISSFDTAGISLTDTNYRKVYDYKIIADTANNLFTIISKWIPDAPYILTINKDAFADSAGLKLVENDTIKFFTKKTEDYGSVRLRFKKLDLAKNPVLQLVQGERIIESVPLTQREWSRKLFQPGDYELRILNDSNKNGVWDPGSFFGKHLQPEVVNRLSERLNVRANWDNEKEY